MQKGVSPAIAFVMLMLIGIISTMGLYYWLAGSVEETEQTILLNLQCYAVNSTLVSVTNVGGENSSAVAFLNYSGGSCDFSPAIVLSPGIAQECTLSSPASGVVTFYGTGFNPSCSVDFT